MAGAPDKQSRQNWSNSVYAFRLAIPPSLSNADMEVEDIIPINEKVVRDAFVRFMALILFSVPKYLKSGCFKDSNRNDDEAKKSGAEKDDSDQDVIFELDEHFKIEEFICGSGSHMLNFLNFLLRRKLLRDMLPGYRYYRSSSGSDNVAKQNRNKLLEDYRTFSSSMHLSFQIRSSSDFKKNEEEPVMYNDGKDEMVQYEEDTLFTTITSKMEVEGELQEFHKTATFFPKRKQINVASKTL